MPWSVCQSRVARMCTAWPVLSRLNLRPWVCGTVERHGGEVVGRRCDGRGEGTTLMLLLESVAM
jgi:hypothetical protein